MKDKKNYLKIAYIIEFIYIIITAIYYLFFKKFSDETLAVITMLIISLWLNIILFKESKLDIKKISKIKVLLISIWFLFEPIIPGVFGLIFLQSIKNKKAYSIPVIKEDKKDIKTYVKAVSIILIFLLLMFLLPNLKIFEFISAGVIYLTILIVILLFYFKEIKKSFILFKDNLKVYIPLIVKRYFIMLGLMLMVAVPIVLINGGNTSTNQQMVNTMFKSLPIKTFILSTIYAPFAEEMIFRFSLSKLFNNKTLFIMVSGVLFGSLHVIGKFTNFSEFLYIIQYSTLGICLAKAYKDTNNIFVSISMHFMQNFLAAILVLLVL